jgi:hypothetical protein
VLLLVKLLLADVVLVALLPVFSSRAIAPETDYQGLMP